MTNNPNPDARTLDEPLMTDKDKIRKVIEMRAFMRKKLWQDEYYLRQSKEALQESVDIKRKALEHLEQVIATEVDPVLFREVQRELLMAAMATTKERENDD